MVVGTPAPTGDAPTGGSVTRVTSSQHPPWAHQGVDVSPIDADRLGLWRLWRPNSLQAVASRSGKAARIGHERPLSRTADPGFLGSAAVCCGRWEPPEPKVVGSNPSGRTT